MLKLLKVLSVAQDVIGFVLETLRIIKSRSEKPEQN